MRQYEMSNKHGTLSLTINEVVGEDEIIPRSTYDRVWIHMLAGGTAGFVSRTLTAPLDRLKTMAQLQGVSIRPMSGVHMMIKEGGYISLFRGNGTNLIKVVPEITLKFALFNELMFLMNSSPTVPISHTFLAGALTGIVNQILLHPMEVLKTRLVLRKTADSHRMIDQVRKGLKMYGKKFTYLGFVPALIGKTIFTSVDFAVYQMCKSLMPATSSPMEKTSILVCGLCSSFVSLVASYPFGVLTTHRQASDRDSFLSYRALLKLRGPIGMYSGFSNAIFKIVPSYAIAYVCYESVLEAFGETMAMYNKI